MVYLREEDELGDLDLAVKLVDRNPNDTDRDATMTAYAKKSGRHFKNIVEECYWPEIEILQILKARKRTISIQDWESVWLTGKSSPHERPLPRPEVVRAGLISRITKVRVSCQCPPLKLLISRYPLAISPQSTVASFLEERTN